MTQTAVEFLFEMLKDSSKEVFDGNIWEQAKEMERNQIIDAYMARMDITDKEYVKQIIGVQYYNETYKQDI